MLRIVVCVKAVPDPKEADKIRIDPVTRALTRGDVPLVLNPLDKHAMEAALQLKEQLDAHIAVISMGPPPAGKIVRECLALGADQGFLLSDPAFAGVDLAEALRARDYIGRAPQQVDRFLKEFVTPIRRRYRGALGRECELDV